MDDIQAEGPDQSGGWREQKRRETLQRITEAAMRLFTTQGFEATTLDDIAVAAGISKRTFFYYFAGKEEVLAAWQQGLPEGFKQALLVEEPDRPPLDLVHQVQRRLMSRRDAAQARAVNRIIRENEKLRAANQAKFLQLEQAVFQALAELWPEPDRRDELRSVSMVSTGALRLAIDAWSDDGGPKPIADYLDHEMTRIKRLCSE